MLGIPVNKLVQISAVIRGIRRTSLKTDILIALLIFIDIFIILLIFIDYYPLYQMQKDPELRDIWERIVKNKVT